MRITLAGMEKYERCVFSIFLILSSLTFPMVIMKSAISPIFGVYKEFFSIIIILMCLVFNKLSLPVNYYKVFLSFVSFTFFSIITSSLYNPLPLFNYIYEAKIVGFYFLLFAMMFFLTKTKENTDKLVKIFIKILFFFAIVNIMFAVIQRLFFSDIISSFGFSSSTDIRDSFGNENNIVLQTQGGKFRAIGTFSAPMVLAEYLLFAGFFFALRFKNHILKLFWFTLCSIGIYFTAYKTALMYLPAIAMIIFLPIKYVRLSVLFYGLALATFGFLSTHTHIIYDIVNPIHPMYAEYSIRLRIQFVYDVLSQMNNVWQFLFGAGYGYNGGFLGYFDNSVPLDSIYLWILSNYGIFGVIFSMIGLLVFYFHEPYKKFDQEDEDYKICYFLKLYIFTVIVANLFWNNVFINFPSLFFPIVAYVLFYKKCHFKYGN